MNYNRGNTLKPIPALPEDTNPIILEVKMRQGSDVCVMRLII
jgi:hypothetical protein